MLDNRSFPHVLLVAFVFAEALALLIFGVMTLPGFSDVAVAESSSVALAPYSTSALLFLIATVLAASAVSFWLDKWWGWGLVVVLNICFVPVAYYISQSGRIAAAIVVAIIALAVLWASFSRQVLARKRAGF